MWNLGHIHVLAEMSKTWAVYTGMYVKLDNVVRVPFDPSFEKQRPNEAIKRASFNQAFLCQWCET